jgi:mannose-6-phosphate isomerase-like protein (cupin superfamily)
LTVHPRSSFELPPQTKTAYHLFVLKGRAKFITGSEDKTLRSGEAITWHAEKQANIENAAKTELSVIQVELKNQVDK